MATIIVVGLLSLKFFPSLITVAVTLCISILFLVLMRKRISQYYGWFETKFTSSLQQEQKSLQNQTIQEQLAPWDAFLIEIKVPTYSFITGKNLLELKLREKYGVNIVAIERGENTIISPKINEPIYPGDQLLCFSTDQEIEKFKTDLEISCKNLTPIGISQEYNLQRFIVKNNSYLNGITINDAAINEKFNCIVVGIERENSRIKNPKASTVLKENDILWIVGENKMLESFSKKI